MGTEFYGTEQSLISVLLNPNFLIPAFQLILEAVSL